MEFVFGDMPEEMKQMLHEQQQQREMIITYKRTAWNNLVSQMDAESLAVFKMLIEDISQNESLAHYMIGWISAMLINEHKVCEHCGVKHDDPFDHAAAFTENRPQPNPALGPDTEEGRKAMEDYNLDDLRTEEDRETVIGFVCKGCGQRYVSIEDRMLRAPGPEGCGGCQQKAKWG
jgi:hypothetical protein